MDEHTMVTAIVQSSIPIVPPQQGSRAIIRSTKMTSAMAPPASPVIETTSVRSRTGCPQVVAVTFLVAAVRKALKWE